MVSTHALDWSATDERAVDLIRVLAMDAVQEAGNGHPGTASIASTRIRSTARSSVADQSRAWVLTIRHVSLPRT